MLRFVLRRLFSAVPTIFIVVTISFFLIRFAPGGPFNIERALPPQIMANMMRAYHLDQPLCVQYLHYLWNVLHLDFGPSYIYRDFTVAQLIGQSLPYSLELGSFAMIIAVVGGVAAGVLAALRQNGVVDYALMAVATVGLTVPNFVVGPVLSLIFAVMLSWVSAGGWGNGGLRDLALPVIALALPQLAIFARLTRGSMIETLRADHIRTARAYGLPPRVGRRRSTRFAARFFPVVTYLAPAAAAVLTGSVVIETIFSIPGVGRYFVARRAQPRLHAGDGNGGADRRLHHRLQPRSSTCSTPSSIRGCAMIEADAAMTDAALAAPAAGRSLTRLAFDRLMRNRASVASFCRARPRRRDLRLRALSRAACLRSGVRILRAHAAEPRALSAHRRAAGGDGRRGAARARRRSATSRSSGGTFKATFTSDEKIDPRVVRYVDRANEFDNARSSTSATTATRSSSKAPCTANISSWAPTATAATSSPAS